MEAPAESELLNICIVPPPDIAKRCVSLSKNLASPETLFTVDGMTTFPHLTLFMARFPVTARASVVATVEDTLAGRYPFTCTHDGFHTTPMGYGEASFNRTDELADLHENMISMVKEFRFSAETPFIEEYFGSYTEAQRHNAESTGYDLAHELYRPHITLVRYAEGITPNEVEFSRLCEGSSLSFSAHSICVYKADQNGAVHKRIAVYSLENQS